METLLITGASSGIGYSLARHFSSRFHVLAIARRASLMRERFQGIPNISPYQTDVADTKALKQTLALITQEHGPVSYVINNAGVMAKSGVSELTEDTLEASLRVNFLAVFTVMKEVLPSMRDRNFGRIINVTSGAPLNCFPEFSAYSATKAAMNALTVTAAREHASQNIKINLMSPGPCKTEMAPNAPHDPSVCHPTAEYLLNLDSTGPTGGFFWMGYQVPLFPDLSDVDWLKGVGGASLRKVL